MMSIGLLGAALGTGADAPVRRAAPWAIMIHGSLVEKPITLSSWHENLRLMLAISPGIRTRTSTLEGRAYIDMALFWGPEWKHLADSPEAVARLRPDQASQYGRLYPARGNAPAVVVLDAPSPNEMMLSSVKVRVLEREGLAVLEKYGIPVRLTQ
jgi:hypothetical protein